MNYEVNESIRASQVRLIGVDGEQIGIISTKEALSRARISGLDLVAISGQAKPPVCKILDYGKFKYEQSKKQKDAAKKSREARVELKELYFRPGTDTHDVDIKLRKAMKFLADGNKVKFTVRFKGRENARKEQGRVLLAQILERLGEEVKPEHPIKDVGRTVMVVVAPNKK